VSIVGQPVDARTCPGQPVTFSVAALGTGPLRYQWRKDGTGVPGARTNTFIIANVAVADAGKYDVVVSGVCGSISSASASLVVNASAPVIDRCPSDQTVTATNCNIAVPDLTGQISAHDACTPTNLLSVTQFPLPGSMAGVGQTVVTLTVA